MLKHSTPEEASQRAEAARQRLCERLPSACEQRAKRRPTFSEPSVNSGIGTCLKDRFGSRWIVASSGCACERMARELDGQTPEQVEARIEPLIDGIYANIDHLDGVAGIAIRALKAITPASLIKARIRSEVEHCITTARHAQADTIEE